MDKDKKHSQLIQLGEKPKRRQLYPLVALPWCCIVPIFFAWLGTGSALFATILSPLTQPLLATSAILLGYSHYRVWVRGHRSRPQLFWLTITTILSISFWTWSIVVMGALSS